MDFQRLVLTLLTAQILGVFAAVTGVFLALVSSNSGAIRGACVLTALALLVQGLSLASLRLGSPDISVKWMILLGILAQGFILAAIGFSKFQSDMRYVCLAISSLAPLMLTLVRRIE
jgi:hypothetical protein